MEEKFNLKNCGENDVLSFKSAIFKVNKLRQEVENILGKYKLGEELSNKFGSQNIYISVGGKGQGRNYYHCCQNWFGDGIDCEVLKIGAKGWQKGKVKINLQVSLEFSPDEPEVEEIPEITQLESPLDDMRRMISQDS